MIRDLLRAAFPAAGESPRLFPWLLLLGLRFLTRPRAMAAMVKAVKAARRREAVKNDLYPLW